MNEWSNINLIHLFVCSYPDFPVSDTQISSSPYMSSSFYCTSHLISLATHLSRCGLILLAVFWISLHLSFTRRTHSSHFFFALSNKKQWPAKTSEYVWSGVSTFLSFSLFCEVSCLPVKWIDGVLDGYFLLMVAGLYFRWSATVRMDWCCSRGRDECF